jgi:hypothetical protein
MRMRPPLTTDGTGTKMFLFGVFLNTVKRSFAKTGSGQTLS